MKTETVKFIEQILETEPKNPEQEIVAGEGRIRRRDLVIWQSYLRKQITQVWNPNLSDLAINEGAKIRKIRSSIIISYMIGNTMAFPILHERKNYGRATVGKFLGGWLEPEKSRTGAEAGVKEAKEELHTGQHKLYLEKITPEEVLKCEDGKILQVYHAPSKQKLTERELSNVGNGEIIFKAPGTEETFNVEYQTIESLTRKIEGGSPFIHKETLEAIISHFLWKKSVHALEIPIKNGLREKINEKTGLYMPPESLKKANVYMGTSREGLPPAIRIYIAAGIFLHQIQFGKERTGMTERPADFEGRALQFTQDYVQKNWRRLMEKDLLERYML